MLDIKNCYFTYFNTTECMAITFKEMTVPYRKTKKFIEKLRKTNLQINEKHNSSVFPSTQNGCGQPD